LHGLCPRGGLDLFAVGFEQVVEGAGGAESEQTDLKVVKELQDPAALLLGGDVDAASAKKKLGQCQREREREREREGERDYIQFATHIHRERERQRQRERERERETETERKRERERDHIPFGNERDVEAYAIEATKGRGFVQAAQEALPFCMEAGFITPYKVEGV
jgi:hypothetical protein